MNRRRMLQASVATGLSLTALTRETAAAAGRGSRFTMDLTPGAIGVEADLRGVIELAHRYGFQSVQPDSRFLARLSDSERERLLEDLRRKHLVWGSAGLPVDFRTDDGTFRAGMQKLPGLVSAMQKVGVSRVSTWLKPCHESLTWLQNFKRHAHRLREVAHVLADHDQRFGLEYVGTKLSWTSSRHSFVHTMAETKELLAEIGRPNVGIVLDSWHWYTAGETADDLRTLSNADIVACDLNDAPAGIPVDQQIDHQRELPAATGVINVKAFLEALIEIGYDGPIRAEPFNRKLNALDDEAASRTTAAAMKQAFASPKPRKPAD